MSISVWRALPVLMILFAACILLPASASPSWQNATGYLTAATHNTSGVTGVQETTLVTKWHVETVDRSLRYGLTPSLAFDSSDTPHIAYDSFSESNPFSNSIIKYATKGSSGWKKSVFFKGGFPSLQIDANGNPRISYFQFEGGTVPSGMLENAQQGYFADLFYGWKDGTGLHSEYVTTASGFPVFRSSLDLNGRGKPRISFTGPWESAFPVLKYAWKNTAWDDSPFGTIDYREIGECPLALDRAGNPGIAYSYYSPGGDGTPSSSGIRYVWKDGTGEHEENVVSSTAVGQYLSLARDASGRPHIAYFDPNAGSVMYAWKDAGSWHTKRVGPASSFATTSVAIDSNGRPHIAYIEMGTSTIRYATLANGKWETEIIDRGADSFVSIALNSRNTPAVSYLVNGDGSAVLKFATPGGSYMGRIL